MTLEEMLKYAARQFANTLEEKISAIENKIMQSSTNETQDVNELKSARDAVKRAGSFDGKSCARCWVYDGKLSNLDNLTADAPRQHKLRCSVCTNEFVFDY